MKFSPWVSVTVLGFALSGLLAVSPSWQRFELWAFDRWTVWSAPGKSRLPITIVGIDEASFGRLNTRWPWSREWHARVIQTLIEDGAAVVGYDVLFAEAATEAEDKSLESAIALAPGSIVLSADHAYQETNLLRQWVRVDPLLRFRQAGARSGLTTAELDSDTLIRRFPDGPDVFWREAIAAFQRKLPEANLQPYIPDGAMIRHLGPSHTFPYISFEQILNKDPSIPIGHFKDQIVLIGRDVRANPETGSAQSDLFSTPFIGTSKLLVPGVEIHATLIENALTGLAVQNSKLVERLPLSLSIVLLGAIGLRLWRPAVVAIYFTVLAFGALALSFWSFTSAAAWLPVSGAIATLVSMYVGMLGWSFILEQNRSRQIKSTFAKYVAPEVVDQMIARPELLRLGGERREVTLLFCDLAGFTSMSEKLEPEQIAIIINKYLTAMAKVIMMHGGTVDKYIGDAVMAFWGAPLEDKHHAQRALKAASEMQDAMVELQTLAHSLGIESLSLRIGLHTGTAVIGNMGSEDRFDYTALGDTVNLASRLEGVNKYYGTEILLSEVTAIKANAMPKLRVVDWVRVKGKQEVVKLFTPCSDEQLNQLSRQAFTSYLNADWTEALSQYEHIKQRFKNDQIAELFIDRISLLQRSCPNPWDGAISIDKL
jgi:adenylate cyclase